MNEIKYPNFLIAGAVKSGTTSLWYYLKQHPDIFMPEKKELKFLSSSRFISKDDAEYKYQLKCKCYPYRSIDEYLSEFRNATYEKAIGEASPQYLFTHKTTIPVIKKYLGDPKIIIMLRNPVDRAYSAYNHRLKNRNWSSFLKGINTFEEEMGLEEYRMRNGQFSMMTFYKNLGLYYEQVKAYVDNFTVVKVCLYDDLVSDPGELLKEIYRFLGVDEKFEADLRIKQNVSPPMNNVFQRILFSKSFRGFMAPLFFKIIGEKNSMHFYNYFVGKFEKNEMNPETRKYLTEYFREDVLNLQDLIDIDLSHWLLPQNQDY